MAAWAAPGVARADGNLVQNGDFEAPPVSVVSPTNTPHFDTFSSSPAGFIWTISRGSIDLINSLYWQPYSGSQSIDLDGNSPATISQSLTTQSGQAYTLSFAYSGNPDCGATHTREMDVMWGSTDLGTFSWSGATTRPAMTWKTVNVAIPGSATGGSSTTLAFVSDDSESSCGIALDDVSVVATSSGACSPGKGQVALFTGTNYMGQCAVYPIGTYQDVSAGGGIPDGSAESIEVGAGAFAVLDGVKGFGNGVWANVGAADGSAVTDANLGDNTYLSGGSVLDSVSAMYVLPTGCTPDANQISLYALPNSGGGCVNFATGDYPDFTSEDLVENDWARSIAVGSAEEAQLFLHVQYQGEECDFAENTQANLGGGPNDLCDIVNGAPELSSMHVIAPPKTPGTVALATAAITSSAASKDGTGTSVTGTVQGGTASTSYQLSFYADTGEACDTSGAPLGTTTVTTDSSGGASFAFLLSKTAPSNSQVSVVARIQGVLPVDPNRLPNPYYLPTDASCAATTQADANTTWTNAEQINLADNGKGTGTLVGGVTNEALNNSGESRWYYFDVTPGGTVSVDLTGLPANYDLALFTDIQQASNDLSNAGLQQQSAELGAQFAGAFYTPTDVAGAFYTGAFYTGAFYTGAFYTDAAESGAFYTPDTFSGAFYTPGFFNSSAQEQAYESAQYRSLYGLSENDGTADEHIFANIFNHTERFYIRVSGRNGAYVPGADYDLQVTETTGACNGVSPSSTPTLPADYSAPAGGYQTLILTDWGRLTKTFGSADVATLQGEVSQLAAATNGTTIDVGTNSVVSALNTQADGTSNPQNTGCPYAKNLVAGAVKDIVTAYRATNPVKYVVIVGDDHIIPFFRYPDTAGVGSEDGYVPPVQIQSPSEASLAGNYVLSQDAYGSTTTLDLANIGVDLPVPGLPVGRLVETPSEIGTMINAYLGLSGASVDPTSALVTGYDFMASGADSVKGDLTAGLGSAPDTLIDEQGTPQDQLWTADQLRTKLLGSSHSLIYLSGHFSANLALAADYTTTISSTELYSSPVDLTNSIVVSGGCHSGYNLVNGDAIPGVTQPLDWTEAFAHHGATLIAGTGYQYGDTDFLAYSQKLYAGFFHALRYGSGPVDVGAALVQAKKDYLAADPSISGIDAKALLEATLYGLPMLSVDLPDGRNQSPPSKTSVVTPPTTQATTDPGKTLGLSWFDYTTTPATSTNNTTFEDTSTNPPTNVKTTYLSGPDGAVTSPGAPALPLEQDNVDDIDPYDATHPAGGRVLRGVGFRGGTYTDQSGITPLVGTPATEQSGTHTPFVSSIFYPEKPWSVNYFGSLTGSNAGTQLMVTPAQYMSDGPSSQTDIQRTYSSLSFRLFYSGNTQSYNGNVPALSGPPTIARVDAALSGGSVKFQVHVVGDPSAGIQQVWVTYAGVDPGQWESLDLVQDANDSTLWAGSLPLNGADPSKLRFMAQAVNGVGIVALDDNSGAYYSLGGIVPALQTPTALTQTQLALDNAPASAPYGGSVSVSATLTGSGPLANEPVTFSIGSSSFTAKTDSSGVASTTLPIKDKPGSYTLSAAFNGDATNASSHASAAFAIDKLPTSLVVSGGATVNDGTDTGITATLTSNGRPVSQESVAFVLTPEAGNANPAVIQTRITDGAGQVSLDPLPWPLGGKYDVTAYFGTNDQVTLPSDPVFEDTDSSGGPPIVLTVVPAMVTSITRVSQGTVTAPGTVSWNVDFNISVNGLTKNNFSLTTTGVSGAGNIAIGGTGSTYTVSASTGTGSGTVSLNLSDISGVNDLVGGALGGTFTGGAAAQYTVDADPPTAAITFPANQTVLNSTVYSSGCPTTGICGVATDATGVQSVTLSLFNGSKYWDGSGFDNSTPTWVAATLASPGGTSTGWKYALARPADGSYTLRVRTTDGLGNTQAVGTYSAAATFKVDTTPPTISFVNNKGSYLLTDTVSITCTTADNGAGASGVAKDPCAGFSISGPAYTFALGTNTLPKPGLVATDNVGNATAATTTMFTVSVTPASELGLTLAFVQGSSKYAKATASQRTAITQQIQQMEASTLGRLSDPSLPKKTKDNMVNTWDNYLNALQNSGWLTTAQQNQLTSLANTLAP